MLTRWIELGNGLLSFPVILLFTYALFAGLCVVRLGFTAWESWKRSFHLVPAKDWFRTIGLLILIQVLVFVSVPMPPLPDLGIGQNLDILRILQIILFQQLVVGLPAGLFMWYLTLCLVAIWHHYLTESAPKPSYAPEGAI